MNAKIISDSRVLPFPADAIFDVLASPAGHVEMDGSGTVRGVASGPERLRDGARFRMKMKLGVPYQMSSTVREFEENRRIAWAHVGGHRWRYELEEVDGGTRVTESFDWSTSRAPASSRWSAIRSGTRPICRRPSSDSKRSLPGVGLTDAKRQSRPGRRPGVRPQTPRVCGGRRPNTRASRSRRWR